MKIIIDYSKRQNFLRNFSITKVCAFLLLAQPLFAQTLDSAATPSKWNILGEFRQKLNAKSFLKSTKYYAQGPNYSVGDLVSENDLRTTFDAAGYRLRELDQTVLKKDYTWLDAQTCSNTIQESLLSSNNCILWQTEASDQFLILLETVVNTGAQATSPLQFIVKRTFKLNPKIETPSVELDPILVAQYRGQEPVFQVDTQLAAVPIQCLNAVLAIEDNQFLEHKGVSVTGLGRAIIKNITTLRKAQGGSTITQQLVKNYFLTPEKTYTRKLKEIVMAIRLESEWTKDEILETYLNIIYMGQSGAFQVLGFGAASRIYFAKPLSELNLSECALLAAIINNPGMNNPWRRAEQATKRRSLVLQKMLELGLISESEKQSAEAQALPKKTETLATETAPYYFEAVRAQAQKLGLPVEGTAFFTGLRLHEQDVAQKALQKGIQEREKSKNQKDPLQGVVVSAHLQTGVVTSLVGGQSYRQTQFNRALNSKRQIGSLMKPFVFLAGLLEPELQLQPDTVLSDEKFVWKYDNQDWSPLNYDKKNRGEVPLYYALKESLNIPTARLAQQVGIEKIVRLAQDAGLEGEIPLTPSTSLGASSHSPVEVLQAFSTLALLGKKPELSFILKAVDRDNQVFFQHQPHFETIYDEAHGAVLVGMMQETLRTGTAKASKAFGFTGIAAGKTGTTSNNKDVWFTGFTPSQITVVWLGYDEGRSTKLTGASGALPIWCDVMAKLTSQKAALDFPWPESIEPREVEFTSVNEKPTLIFLKQARE